MSNEKVVPVAEKIQNLVSEIKKLEENFVKVVFLSRALSAQSKQDMKEKLTAFTGSLKEKIYDIDQQFLDGKGNVRNPADSDKIEKKIQNLLKITQEVNTFVDKGVKPLAAGVRLDKTNAEGNKRALLALANKVKAAEEHCKSEAVQLSVGEKILAKMISFFGAVGKTVLEVIAAAVSGPVKTAANRFLGVAANVRESMEPFEDATRVYFIGPQGAGKTAMVNQLADNGKGFPQKHEATIGYDWCTSTAKNGDKTRFFDIGGQQKLLDINAQSLKSSPPHLIFLVLDAKKVFSESTGKSLETLNTYKTWAEKNAPGVPIQVVINKTDELKPSEREKFNTNLEQIQKSVVSDLSSPLTFTTCSAKTRGGS